MWCFRTCSNVDADKDDNNDDVVAEADVQQPVEVEQPGDPTNLGDAADDDDEVDFPEIQGVDEEAINPETPGVGMMERTRMKKKPLTSHHRYHA